MSGLPPKHIILANGARGPRGTKADLRLHYIQGHSDHTVHIGLPNFVRDVYHLPERILDLLEIAGYVFAADRRIIRGRKDALEYHSWSRSLQFHIRVRDYTFWSQKKVKTALSSALTFMTGDAEYSFAFEPGHTTPPTSLFDQPYFTCPPDESGVQVTLFSGGLDSLYGAIELLESGDSKIILVSHQSQSGTIHTQRVLVDALKKKYPDRIYHYRFECTLRGVRAREETQRTRSFLYTSIAYAIAHAYGQDSFNVYENGITSINLRRREDLANARASRTTHPQTMAKMANLFALVANKQVKINLPLLYQTKTDIMTNLLRIGPDLLSSAVSCTRTFQTEGPATHCGQCFQCVDRRMASHAAGAYEIDHSGLYTHDFIAADVEDREAKTTLVDYIRQAIALADSSSASFEDEYLTELAELIDYVHDGNTDGEKVHALWVLFHRHGTQIKAALVRMRQLYEDLSQPVPRHSLLHIVASREYLKPGLKRLVDSIADIISPALGDMFSRNKPKDEPDLNEKLGVLLRSHDTKIRSEHPTTSFACARVVPDHMLADYAVLIEAKYIREGTAPSQATEGIAADLTKYPPDSFILFVVYDPIRRITSDDIFRADIESKGRNRVLIVR